MEYDNALAGNQLAFLLSELGGWVSMENTFADDALAAAQADAALAQGFDIALFQNALGWLTSVSAAGQALGNARLDGALTWTNSIAGNLQTLADGFIDHAVAEVNSGADALQTLAGSQGNSLLNWAAANGATGLVTTGGGTIGTNGSGGGVVAFGQPAGGNQGGLPWYNPLGWFQTNWDDAVNEELQIVQQLNRQFGTSHVSLGAFTPEERAAIEQALGRSFDWDNMPLQGAKESLEDREDTLARSRGYLLSGLVVDGVGAVGVLGQFLIGGGAVGIGGGAALSPSAQRAVESLRHRIAEHQQKLADYIRDPDAFDNLGFLKNAPTAEIRQQIISGRIRHLQQEISAFQDQITRIIGGQ